jgi:hypothetical protein
VILQRDQSFLLINQKDQRDAMAAWYATDQHMEQKECCFIGYSTLMLTIASSGLEMYRRFIIVLKQNLLISDSIAIKRMIKLKQLLSRSNSIETQPKPHKGSMSTPQVDQYEHSHQIMQPTHPNVHLNYLLNSTPI